MASSIDPVLAYAEEALRDVTSTRYTLAASLVVLFYDWFLTLGSEIEVIWSGKRSIVKTIFLVNRYFAPILLIWANYAWSGHALWFKPLSCRAYLVVDSCLIIGLFVTLHYIVSLRAWALYGRSKTVGFILWGGFAIYLVAAYVTTIMGLLSIPATLYPIVNICFGPLPSYLWAIWLPSIVFETLVFGLTLYKAVQIQSKNVNTPILSTLFRDGFLYFLFISINSAINLVFWAIAPPTKVLLVKYLSTAVALSAGSHLILDLREVGHALTQTSEVMANSKGEPVHAHAHHHQLRRLSITPRSPVFAERGEHSRLIPLTPISPKFQMNRSHDDLHFYPPSPLAPSPSTPPTIRFARNL